tara:strand:- start:817 stop:1293 length:477 start_codon:yes stop_codon:yes gene_type:complete
MNDRRQMMLAVLDRANQIDELISLSETYVSDPPEGDLAELSDYYTHEFNATRFVIDEEKDLLRQVSMDIINTADNPDSERSVFKSLESDTRDLVDYFRQDGDAVNKNWGWDDFSFDIMGSGGTFLGTTSGTSSPETPLTASTLGRPEFSSVLSILDLG